MKLMEKIRKARKGKGLSQGELADLIKMNPNHLSRLETGKFQPSIEILKKLADALEVSVDYLLSDSDDEPQEIKIEDAAFAEKIRLLNMLDGKDRDAIMHIIDSILTKKKIQALLQESAA